MVMVFTTKKSTIKKNQSLNNMKNLFLISVLFLMASCAGAFKINAEIGMTESEFKKKNMGYSVAEMTADYTIYRVISTYGPDKFVYFQDGKMVKMDEGEYYTKYVIDVE